MTHFPAGRFSAPRKAIIMGATSGAGLRCAHILAAHGIELVLSDSNGPALRALSRELDCLGRYCDVASEASVTIFAAEMRALMPSVDLLINAAGPGYVRALGMLRVSKAVMPQLRATAGGACVINVAPAGGAKLDDGLFQHASSANGFVATSRAMAAQAPLGVRVMTCREPSAERLVARLAGRFVDPQSKAA